MKVSEVYGSQYATAADLPDKPLTLEILAVEAKEMEDKDEGKTLKLILTLKGCRKKVVLNATNSKFMASLIGDETDDWPGCQVVLERKTTPSRNGVVPCIRVTDCVKGPTRPTPKPNGGLTNGTS